MAKLTLWHGGQTGVDRGCHDAGMLLGVPLAGYMPADGHDEFGLIPIAVAKHLRRCQTPGYGPRTKQNLAQVYAVLVIVENKQNPYATPGTRLTLDGARDRRLARRVIDPDDSIACTADWLSAQYQDIPTPNFALLIAGPRASKWPGGQAATCAVLQSLHATLVARGVICPT